MLSQHLLSFVELHSVTERGLKNEDYHNLFLTCLVFSTQICLHVLMEVSVSTERRATAVDLMQLDQDARQVCKERKLTGFLGLYSGSHSYKNDYSLPKGCFLP